MPEALSVLLWAWIGTPIAAIGAVGALLIADAQWKRTQEWGRRTWVPVTHRRRQGPDVQNSINSDTI